MTDVVRSLLGDDGDILHERNFQALLAANLMAPLGVPLVSPLLSTLTGPFGVSSARIGLLISAYTAPPILLIPIAGVLSDRYGRKPLLLSGILLFGAGGVGVALTTDFRAAVAFRFLQGIGFAGLTPIIVTSLGDLYAGPREATAQGLRFTSSGVYQSVFPPIAAVLVGIAWQYPFLLYALAFPIAGLVYLWFDEPMTSGRAARDGRGSPDGGSPGELPADGPGRRREFIRLVTRRRVLALLAGRSLPMMTWIGFLTYNSILVVQLIGGSPFEAGILVTVNSVTLAIGGSQAGRITSRFDSRLWPLVAANFGLGAGLAIVALGPSLPVAVVGVVLLGTGFGVSLSLYRSIVTGLAPATQRGSLVSVAESLGRVASTVTPIAMGALVTALTPVLGFAGAVRWTAVALGVFVAAGGQLCLVVARLSSETPAERDAPRRTRQSSE